MIFPLVGNLRVRESVLATIKGNKIPHALIIEGDKGTGRHTLASYITLAAVCEAEDKPCEECTACRIAKGGNHPDIAVVAPEEGKKNISVAQVRKVREDTFVKPHRAGKKVFIIDGADLMNEQSQNALLKILEEPPENVVFILIAESKSALLETVISRCVCISLSAPDFDTSKEYIKSLGKYNEEEINIALAETDGNIGKAFDILEGDSSSEFKTLTGKFLSYMLDGNEFEMLKLVSRFEKNRIDAEKFIKELKICVGVYIKENLSNRFSASALSNFYDELLAFEKSLITNININLLFSSIVAKAAKIIKN